MADRENPSRRDSHFNHQRSSWHSESSSGRTRSQSRSLRRATAPAMDIDDYMSSQRPTTWYAPTDINIDDYTLQRSPTAHALTEVDDYTLQDLGEVRYEPSPVTTPSDSSPAPNVPRARRGSLDRKRWTTGSGRTGSRPESSRGNTSRPNSRGKAIEEVLRPRLWDRVNETQAPPPLQNPDERSTYRHTTLEEERGESRASRHLSSPHPGQLPGSTLDITALPDLSNSRPLAGLSNHSRILTELYTISYLILFSILGTLARLGLQWLTYYPGAPLTFSELWANVGGTLVMGFLAQDRMLFREEWGNLSFIPPRPGRSHGDEEKGPRDEAHRLNHGKVKKSIPLYIGLATGFCGSFTSFSSFIRDTFLAFVNDLPNPNIAQNTPRNDGYSFMAGLAVIFITLALCYAALNVGAHIALFAQPWTPTLPFRFTRRFLDPCIVVIAWLAWLGAIIMAIWPPDRPSGPASRGPSWENETWRGDAIFACVFAPLGCLLRFYLSLALNPLIASFPLGTFAVNIFGTAVLGMAFDLQRVAISVHGIGGGRVGCQVLQGVMDGFCGALTTISTWILEIDGLKRRHAYTYASASVWTGVLMLVAVMGGVKWTVGWSAIACAQ